MAEGSPWAGNSISMNPSFLAQTREAGPAPRASSVACRRQSTQHWGPCPAQQMLPLLLPWRGCLYTFRPDQDHLNAANVISSCHRFPPSYHIRIQDPCAHLLAYPPSRTCPCVILPTWSLQGHPGYPCFGPASHPTHSRDSASGLCSVAFIYRVAFMSMLCWWLINNSNFIAN